MAAILKIKMAAMAAILKLRWVVARYAMGNRYDDSTKKISFKK